MKTKFYMKILFCGSYIPPDQIKYFQYSSEAGNNFQHNLVRNLEKNNSVEIFSYVGFPMKKKLAKKLAEKLKREGIHYILRLC